MAFAAAQQANDQADQALAVALLFQLEQLPCDGIYYGTATADVGDFAPPITFAVEGVCVAGHLVDAHGVYENQAQLLARVQQHHPGAQWHEDWPELPIKQTDEALTPPDDLIHARACAAQAKALMDQSRLEESTPASAPSKPRAPRL